MKRVALAACAAIVIGACAASNESEPVVTSALRVPSLGPVPAPTVFAGDEPTDAKKSLGAAIFFDERLSGTKTTNCASCHIPATAFQDNLVASTPDRVKPGAEPKLGRNTPSFLNLIYAPVTRWDGSLGVPGQVDVHLPAADLLDVLTFPFVEPNMDLGATFPEAEETLKRRLTVEIPGYTSLFQTAFIEDIRKVDGRSLRVLTGRAIRAFLYSVVSKDSAFDRWNAGDDSAMSPRAVAGLELFRGKGHCIDCHDGPMFTDYKFHNLSTSPPGPDGKRSDEGLYYLTKKDADRGKFLTPTLRDVYDTGPYFHAGTLPDGTVSGLLNVLHFFSSSAVMADPNSDFPGPLSLTEDEIDDLIAFMKALRGAPNPVIERPVMP